jgi:hypothetical protein
LKNSENLLLVSIIAFNPAFYYFKNEVLSDIPFFFFSLVSLLLIKIFVVSNKVWINKYFSYFLIGFLVFFTSEIRSIGFVLIPTLLVAQFIESRASKNKSVLDLYNFIPYITFLTFYFIKSLIIPSSITSYFFQGHSLGQVLQLIIPHIKLFVLRPSSFFLLDVDMRNLSQNYNNFHFYLYCTVMLFIILGIIYKRKKDYIFTIHGIFTLVVLILYPYSHAQCIRYIFSILPFYLYFLFAGLSGVTLSLSITDKVKNLNINVVHLIGSVLLIMSLFQISHHYMAYNKIKVIGGPYTADSIELFDYIKKNTNKDDIINFMKPRAMSFYTNRRSIKDVEFDQLSNLSADYMAYIKIIPWWYKFNAQDLKGNFKCVFENNEFILCDLNERVSKD